MRFSIIRTDRLIGCAVAAVLAMTLGNSVFGQGSATAPPPGSPAPGDINPRAADRGRQLAEGRLRSAELDAAAESESKKHIQDVIVHMKEDFTRIQVIRNDIARNLVAHKPLDYNLIVDQTAEIHKRASRLNVYMLAHAPDNKDSDQSELQADDMISALVRLCKLVDSFTENPALKNVATVDVKEIDKIKEEKARADKDLIDIIKLSDVIRKRSDSLKGH
jgi:hypothetical protein